MWICLFLSLVALYTIGLTWSMLTVRSLKSQGYTEMEYRDCFNPTLWVAFAYGKLWNWFVPQHVMEQLILRYYDGFCKPNCYDSEDGKCVKCGCDAKSKAAVPYMSCAGGYWGPIIFSKLKYGIHRIKYPVKLTIEYGKS